MRELSTANLSQTQILSDIFKGQDTQGVAIRMTEFVLAIAKQLSACSCAAYHQAAAIRDLTSVRCHIYKLQKSGIEPS